MSNIFISPTTSLDNHKLIRHENFGSLYCLSKYYVSLKMSFYAKSTR